MYTRERFNRQHYYTLAPNPTTDDLETLRSLERSAIAYTLCYNNQPVATMGVMYIHGQRWYAWALMGAGAGRHMRAITRTAMACLDMTPPGRVDCAVLADFAAGHRWVEMLGFEVETPLLRLYGANGEDYTGYVRIR